MRGLPVDQMVYTAMFPRPKSNDPSNFHALLQRNLIPEVRQETHAFYGHLETQEAKYPGLDYTHKTHRIRLSRWPWHRRLFRAFDTLTLTDAEITGLTKWEGTKWAKEKYEREQGVKIRDTTDEGLPNADDLPDWQPRRSTNRPAVELAVTKSEDEDEEGEEKEEQEEMDVESEGELESVGVQLNERLRAQAARREAGDTHAVLDEEWEQWLKNALESGDLSVLTDLSRPRGNAWDPIAFIPDPIIEAARAGNWTAVPDFLHPLLRRTLEVGANVRTRVNPHPPFETILTREPIYASVLDREHGLWPGHNFLRGGFRRDADEQPPRLRTRRIGADE